MSTSVNQSVAVRTSLLDTRKDSYVPVSPQIRIAMRGFEEVR